MKPPILIPVVTSAGVRAVPHYVNGVEPGSPLVMSGLHEAHTPGGWFGKAEPTEWIPTPTWTGTLTVTGYYKGRSASCYVVRIEVPGELPVTGLMGCAAFRHLIPRFTKGKAAGTFTARKVGQNYLIREPSEPKS